ncbi:MAG: iron chaperone [Flavisolibacter sp.]
MKAVKTVDEYLMLFPDPQRRALETIRHLIKEAAPMADETISYGMPAYKHNGILAYFGGFKTHCSFFPGGSALIEEFSEELKSYRTSKGTIQFPLDKPIPEALIKRMVKEKVKQNLAKTKGRTSAKATARKK